MNIGFVNEKKQNCFEVFLQGRTAKYVNDYFDGKLYVFKDDSVGFAELIKYFTNYRFSLFTRTKIIDACICLLVNPYFDELCNYIKSNFLHMKKKNLSVLEKEVFEKLSNETFKLMMCNYEIEGSRFYIEHNCYEESKKLLLLLHQSRN